MGMPVRTGMSSVCSWWHFVSSVHSSFTRVNCSTLEVQRQRMPESRYEFLTRGTSKEPDAADLKRPRPGISTTEVINALSMSLMYERCKARNCRMHHNTQFVCYALFNDLWWPQIWSLCRGHRIRKSPEISEFYCKKYRRMKIWTAKVSQGSKTTPSVLLVLIYLNFDTSLLIQSPKYRVNMN